MSLQQRPKRLSLSLTLWFSLSSLVELAFYCCDNNAGSSEGDCNCCCCCCCCSRRSGYRRKRFFRGLRFGEMEDSALFFSFQRDIALVYVGAEKVEMAATTTWSALSRSWSWLWSFSRLPPLVRSVSCTSGIGGWDASRFAIVVIVVFAIIVG